MGPALRLDTIPQVAKPIVADKFKLIEHFPVVVVRNFGGVTANVIYLALLSLFVILAVGAEFETSVVLHLPKIQSRLYHIGVGWGVTLFHFQRPRSESRSLACCRSRRSCIRYVRSPDIPYSDS